MEGIDATFIVNLDRSTARMAEMARQCEQQGIPFARFPAVDGAKVPSGEMKRLVAPICRVGCTTSMVGCALSHMALWRTVVERGHARTLVMEDDAQLVPQFKQKLRRALADVPPDFDVLLLGCFFLCNKDRNYPTYLQTARAVLPGKRNDTRTWGSIFVPEFFAGTHCYVVSLQGARKLLQLIPRVTGHIDLSMNHPSLRVYAASPDLAYQRDMSDSSIASFSFPKTLLPLLECVKDSKNVSLAYYACTPLGPGMGITAAVLLMVLAGLAAGPGSAPYLAGFLLVEVALGANVLAPLVAYGLGAGARLALASLF